MIIANELNFIEALKDEGLEVKSINNLRRKFKGWRIYFRSKKSEYDDIKIDYEEMTNAGYTRDMTIRQLSFMYEKSIQRIKDIVAKQGDLFEIQ